MKKRISKTGTLNRSDIKTDQRDRLLPPLRSQSQSEKLKFARRNSRKAIY